MKILSERPQILKNFAAFVQGINEIKAESPNLMAEAEEIELLYQIAEEHGVEPSPGAGPRTTGGARVVRKGRGAVVFGKNRPSRTALGRIRQPTACPGIEP